jgi:hypothetical protein
VRAGSGECNLNVAHNQGRGRGAGGAFAETKGGRGRGLFTRAIEGEYQSRAVKGGVAGTTAGDGVKGEGSR